MTSVYTLTLIRSDSLTIDFAVKEASLLDLGV